MDASAFLKKVAKLPSLPSLYYELERAVENPNSSIVTIGNIVRKDLSMASRLLKLANSAYYSFPTKVETIEEALQLIGLREMRDMALATCVIGTFKDVPPNLVNVRDFWRHSIACGVTSSILAERRHDPTPERFFVGGLLHDIGRLMMYLGAPKESEQILQQYAQEKAPPCRVELQVLGFDHSELGAALLTSWKIPAPLTDMVAHHHAPSPFSASVVDCAIVHYADFITTALEFGSSGERCISPVYEDCLKRFPMDESQIESVVLETEARCEQLCAILSDGQ
jgi:putative nucleotidyltransferase with HDIG domain